VVHSGKQAAGGLSSPPYVLPASDFVHVERLLKDLPVADTSLKGLDNDLRRWIADRKIEMQDLTGAAETLATLRMDESLGQQHGGGDDDDRDGDGMLSSGDAGGEVKSPYFFSDAEKCDVYITVAECYLHEDAPVDADVFVVKAAAVAENVDMDKHEVLLLRYRTCSARVFDANRKYLPASQKYYEVSTTAQSLVDESELLQLLGCSITCAVLGKPSPHRSRLLASLAADPRLQSLSSLPSFGRHATVLLAMARQQLLSLQDMQAFEATLPSHHRAIGARNRTPCSVALMFHNIVALSKLYDAISLERLAELLPAPDKDSARRSAAEVLSSGAVYGELDLLSEMLTFHRGQSSGEDRNSSKRDGVDSKWDDAIETFAGRLQRAADWADRECDKYDGSGGK
jgi:COP9 signalosome complex subunit 4